MRATSFKPGRPGYNGVGGIALGRHLFMALDASTCVVPNANERGCAAGQGLAVNGRWNDQNLTKTRNERSWACLLRRQSASLGMRLSGRRTGSKTSNGRCSPGISPASVRVRSVTLHVGDVDDNHWRRRRVSERCARLRGVGRTPFWQRCSGRCSPSRPHRRDTTSDVWRRLKRDRAGELRGRLQEIVAWQSRQLAQRGRRERMQRRHCGRWSP